MKSFTRRLDAEVAKLARIAKSVAKTQGISAAAAFARITKDVASRKPRPGKPMSALDRAEHFPSDPKGYSPDERRNARERALRFDLEAALLRLDACCSLAHGSTTTYPSHEELEALDGVVNQTVNVIRKSGPALGWPRFEAVDRHFRKLGLCKRVEGAVRRIADLTPQRPLALLMSPEGKATATLTREFFEILMDTRSGKRDPALVDWQVYTPVLLRHQNADRKNPLPNLRPRKGAPTGPSLIEAYVAFLELDRADQQWCLHHGRKISPVRLWLWTLGNANLLEKLGPFSAGTINQVEAALELSDESKKQWKRLFAVERQKKSRAAKKKIGQKV